MATEGAGVTARILWVVEQNGYPVDSWADKDGAEQSAAHKAAKHVDDRFEVTPYVPELAVDRCDYVVVTTGGGMHERDVLCGLPLPCPNHPEPQGARDMSEPMIIDGWRCLVRDSGQRIARINGTHVWLATDGHLCAEKTHGTLGFPHRLDSVPPAVLAWLVAPLIDRGWAQGHASGKRTEAESRGPTVVEHHRLCPRARLLLGECRCHELTPT